jgi:hypothetical protein
VKKINGLMSGIERSFDEQEKKFNRLELAVFGLYALMLVSFVAIGVVNVI